MAVKTRADLLEAIEQEYDNATSQLYDHPEDMSPQESINRLTVVLAAGILLNEKREGPG